jgi:7,8-dihydropterin-6-yl-methyl-4-(beta-D-ribofuranosyl)aminobenzene 5'-phosphate synthase
MNIRDSLLAALIAFSAFAAGLTESAAADAKDQITILYDAFGTNDAMTKDWGFSALSKSRENASCSIRVTIPKYSRRT